MMRLLLIVSNIIAAESAEVDTRFYHVSKGQSVAVEIDVEHGVITKLYSSEELKELLRNHTDNTELMIVTFPLGCTLLPGFIDCHVHLTSPIDDYQMQFLQTSSASHALRGLKNAQGLLYAGFTTLRSAGDADRFYPTVAIAKSIERGEFIGPRIVGAGHYISVTGGGGDINTIAPDNCPCCPADGVIADGRDEMLKAVRTEIKNGSDWIKLLVTGAFMTASTNAQDSPENTHFSTEELAICVQEASRRQVPVMAHAHGGEGITLAVRAGVRSIEHASFIDETGITACLERGTWIVPTFLIGDYFDDQGSDSGAQSRMIALQKRYNEQYYQCITKAAAAGVKVALGSDYVGWDPAITAREFECMVTHAAMTPMQSIFAGTGSAADLLDIPSIGRIRIGNVADMVIVQGDPLQDISLLQKTVCMVMKGGIIVRDDLQLFNHPILNHKVNVSGHWYQPRYPIPLQCTECSSS